MTLRRIMPWLKLLLVNPLTTVALLSLLLVDAWSLPPTDFQGGRSTVGVILHRSSSPNQGGYEGFAIHDYVYVRRTGGTLHVYRPHEDGWPLTFPEAEPETAHVLYIHSGADWHGTGTWAITHADYAWRFYTHGGAGFSESGWATARELAHHEFAESYKSVPWTRFKVVGDELISTKILWTGYAHNAAAVLCFILLLNSLRWIPQSPAYFRARRAARGLCPHCGYSMAGLPAGVCPECGHAIPA